MGRSRGGLTTKIHAVVDAKGLPIRLGLTPGQAYDGEAAMELLNALPENAMVLADKAYDANAIREMINGQGAWANIPPESNRKDPICFSPYLYKARNLVERFFNKIKHFRRIATRYDKLAANYMAMIKLASIRVCCELMSLRPSALIGIFGVRALNSFSIYEKHRNLDTAQQRFPDLKRRGSGNNPSPRESLESKASKRAWAIQSHYDHPGWYVVWRYLVDPTGSIEQGRPVIVWRVDVVFLQKSDWKYEGSKAGQSGVAGHTLLA